LAPAAATAATATAGAATAVSPVASAQAATSASRIIQLEAENKRLLSELDRLRGTVPAVALGASLRLVAAAGVVQARAADVPRHVRGPPLREAGRHASDLRLLKLRLRPQVAAAAALAGPAEGAPAAGQVGGAQTHDTLDASQPRGSGDGAAAQERCSALWGGLAQGEASEHRQKHADRHGPGRRRALGAFTIWRRWDKAT